ncbi:MAG: D-alanyl-D-alanine carboxypeptidase family protein, partial [Bacillota bacterium]|nr:D-alanyl-D-alanine carboxypeptidase family protein [Bacillota bacterium]
QTGLAIDLGLNQENIDFICPDFPYEGICQKFRTVAARFGFIQRYKEEKEKITGISHEPWHFRYVGSPHSELMERMDMSLEEYVEYLKEFPYDGKRLCANVMNQDFEVFYVPEACGYDLDFPEHVVYEVSGNNADGYIVTLWR